MRDGFRELVAFEPRPLGSSDRFELVEVGHHPLAHDLVWPWMLEPSPVRLEVPWPSP
jgi:hypothetical protein